MSVTTSPRAQIDVRGEDALPIERVPSPPSDRAPRLRVADRERVVVDVIHDGEVIPPAYLIDGHGEPIDRERWFDAYIVERDWGAEAVAAELASSLGLESYLRVNVARVLLDFGRFPGMTAPGADHMERYAINYPFSRLLGPRQKRALLADYYDVISEGMEQGVRGKQIKIAVHTYDTVGKAGAKRPEMSVISRSHGLEGRYRGPLPAFDELYPPELGEFTADPVLRDRISLTLQKAGLFVEPNYPYALPEGSLEVRSQVWHFFEELRAQFESQQPETRDDPAFRYVWEMLQDTNLRSAACTALRSYLHQYRFAREDRVDEYRAAREAYITIARFLRRDRGELLARYRRSPKRLSSLGVEVRKDLLWEFDRRGYPVRPIDGAAAHIGGVIARAIQTYLERDRGEAW